MEAVGFALRAELRRRWRSWLVIALLISLVGGFVLAAIAAGRRTDAAFPQFVATYSFDATVYATGPVPELAKLPDVSSAIGVVSPSNGSRRATVPIRSTHPISACSPSPPTASRYSNFSPAAYPTRRLPTRPWPRSRFNKTMECR